MSIGALSLGEIFVKPGIATAAGRQCDPGMVGAPSRYSKGVRIAGTAHRQERSARGSKRCSIIVRAPAQVKAGAAGFKTRRGIVSLIHEAIVAPARTLKGAPVRSEGSCRESVFSPSRMTDLGLRRRPPARGAFASGGSSRPADPEAWPRRGGRRLRPESAPARRTWSARPSWH